MSDNQGAAIGLGVAFAIVAAALVVMIVLFTSTEKVNGHKQWKPKHSSTVQNVNTNPNANGGGSNCKNCSNPSKSVSSQAFGQDSVALPDSVYTPSAPSAVAQGLPDAGVNAQTSSAPTGQVVTFAPQPQVIVIPNEPADTSAAVAAVQAAQASQAFAGEIPASIAKRQALDSFSLASILPAASAAAAGDAAGSLMASLAPNRDKMFAATTQVAACRVPILNGRSPKSRLVGSSGLLRPPVPIPCKSGGGDIAWGDSEMRHYALENNMPPIA